MDPFDRVPVVDNEESRISVEGTEEPARGTVSLGVAYRGDARMERGEPVTQIRATVRIKRGWTGDRAWARPERAERVEWVGAPTKGGAPTKVDAPARHKTFSLWGDPWPDMTQR